MPTPALALPLREHSSGTCDTRLGEETGEAGLGGMSPHGPGPRRLGLAGVSTLDALLTGVWDSLTAHQDVTCPVCGGSMAPRYGAGALPIGGRCADCGSELS